MTQKYTPADIGPLTLSKGTHDDPSKGACIMETVSFLAGEEWSDMPPCSSPVIASFCQVINDRFGQDVRDRLQTYIPRLIGTVSPEHEQERAEFLAWQAIRVFAPIGLEAAGMTEQAKQLREFNGPLGAAADVAARAAEVAAADAVFDALDGVLAIGPSGESYDAIHVERAVELRELVSNK